jgi:hypothetical protein
LYTPCESFKFFEKHNAHELSPSGSPTTVKHRPLGHGDGAQLWSAGAMVLRMTEMKIALLPTVLLILLLFAPSSLLVSTNVHV